MDRRLLLRRLSGSTANVGFNDFTDLIEGFGFRLRRIKGSHHVYRKPGVNEIVNVQPDRGEAKEYQVRQFLKLVERYNLQLEDNR